MYKMMNAISEDMHGMENHFAWWTKFFFCIMCVLIYASILFGGGDGGFSSLENFYDAQLRSNEIHKVRCNECQELLTKPNPPYLLLAMVPVNSLQYLLRKTFA